MSPRLVVVVLRVVERHRGDRVDLRAQKTQQINLALRLGVGHVDNEIVALGAADVGKANSRVTGRALDDGTAGLQESLFLRILDNEESGTVFHAATGVLEFGFTEDVAAGLFGDALQSDEGGVSNCCCRTNILALLHASR